MSGFHMEFGFGNLKAWTSGLPAALVVTDPAPWALVQGRLGTPPVGVAMATSMEEADLARVAASLPAGQVVLGIGGGTAMDAAKYVAAQGGLPYILIPTVTASNAPFTPFVSVRRDGVPVGMKTHGMPERILVDFEVIALAPPALNRAGAGDVLAVHTAIYDWNLAVRAGKARPNPTAYGQAASIVDRLVDTAEAIGSGTGAGLQTLMQTLQDYSEVTRADPPVPGAGSEHLFAWNLDGVTGRHLLHGAAVGLGVLIMAHLQDNEPQRMAHALRAARVPCRPVEDLGVTWADVHQALLGAQAYNLRVRRYYTVLDEEPLDDDRVARLLKRVQSDLATH